MKILYQGIPGAYSHLAALEVYPDAKIIPCKTFDECFERAKENNELKIIIPESNRITGSIGIDYIINLQGDEPNIDLNDLKHLNKLINIHKPQIGTMAAKIDNKSKLNDENVVKVITESKITNENFPIALDFKRRANDQIINIYHHIGIYAFKPKILKNIIKLKQTKNEIKNRLEQLRAMENKIEINVALAKFSPIGIDTMEDYLALKKLLEYNS